ncbi:MAG: hypothetical protein ACK4MT_02310 [Thermaurantiacus tibetensis]|uniref:hypothetical protein n=1 Tax=Thermaurantiacus tibetensis TaxID=2759035 RepID=UPI00188E096B|nr:hypothetical protein [Thermaurantiacus tibetensis]
MEKLDAVRKSVRTVAGQRPTFLDGADSDRLLAMVLALAAELASVYERLDTLERVLEGRVGLDRAELDGFEPDDAASRERMDWHEAMVERVLRVLSAELEALRDRPGTALPEVRGD